MSEIFGQKKESAHSHVLTSVPLNSGEVNAASLHTRSIITFYDMGTVNDQNPQCLRYWSFG